MRDDLRIAYHWFTHPNGQALSHLTPNGNQTVDAIRTALSTHSLDQARQIAFRLTLNSKENPLEVGEILIWSAVYALYLEESEYIHFAKELFQNAVAKYSEDQYHYRAISFWLLGLIHWQYPEYKRHAIYYWEYALRIITHLSYSQESVNPAWYQTIRFHLLEALFHARMFKKHLPIKDVKYFRISAVKKQQLTLSKGASASKSKSSKKPNTIRSLPIYQYVPAGGWGVVEPDQIGQTETDHFMIDNVQYEGKDLLGRGQINIQERESFAIVRIKGTSMNQLDIQSGDYVLIRRQDDANHMDIVLAERINLDAEATLKRYYIQGKMIQLRPQSDDPSNFILSVDNRDNLRILGIAIAVFKPIPLDEPTSETPASPKTLSSSEDRD